MNPPTYTCGCLCGNVRYAATGFATSLCYCHCATCRRAAGAAMVPWGTFARDLFAFTRGRPVEFQSSTRVTRSFCSDCGTSLTYRSEDYPKEIDIALATLDEPGELAPEFHVWVSEKLHWVELCDGLPQFLTSRSEEAGMGSDPAGTA